MKIKYFLGSLFAAAFAFTGCENPDSLVNSESIVGKQLIVKAYYADDDSKEIPGEVDMENGIVRFKVPYYISDVAPIQADLTKMKLRATVPLYSVFEPSLVGVHDLQEGYHSTLIYKDGKRVAFIFEAERVKSNATGLNKLQLTKVSATVKIIAPANGENGKIQILKTTDALINSDLDDAIIEIAPWATIEAAEGIYNPERKRINLSTLPEFKIVAQNGIDKAVYQTEFTTPEMVGPGEIGYISSMFGFQVYKDDPHGFEFDANRTIAVVDKYLILSNSKDFNKMPVMDRYTGKLLTNVKVNCEGIPTDRHIAAITTDDAGHMVAMAYTGLPQYDNPGAGRFCSSTKVLIWVWKNGIEQAPTLILENDMTEPMYQGVHFIGTTISIKGDMTSGDAVLGTHSPWTPRPLLMHFNNGILKEIVVEWRGGAAAGQFGNSSNITPLSTTASPMYEYIADAGAGATQIYYVPRENAQGWLFNLDFNNAHFWTAPDGGYIVSNDYIEFNGVKLLAVMNQFAQSDYSAKFVVSNVTNLNAQAFCSNVIFSSAGGRDGSGGGVPGVGYSVTGVTAGAPYDPSREVLGLNTNYFGDVEFALGEEGKTLQVYMLSANNGLIAYEITLYKL